MTKKLLIASAGAGKTHLIAEQCCRLADDGNRVLVITYTENNQKEIIAKCKSMKVANPRNIVVKGWYSFLLEELIRPYQTTIFGKRIKSINFTSSNPHRNGRFTIRGTAEKIRGQFNPRHFLTACKTKAHTEFLSKLATRVCTENDQKPISRLESVYQHIFIDEVQDLAGWDFDVLKAMIRMSNPTTCVGDFRQTIYSTTSNPKRPSSNQEKLDAFDRLGFERENMAVSRRCIQSICDFADTIHAGEGYAATMSLVENIPEDFQDHLGVFVVPKSKLNDYLEIYSPVILRHSKATARELNPLPIEKVNFGMSKGLGFNRTLVIPTTNILAFINGNQNALNGGDTDKAKNNFYVACTRSRYSLAFLVEDGLPPNCVFQVYD